MKKQLAKWIFWEKITVYYCSDCLAKRLKELKDEKKFNNYLKIEYKDTFLYIRGYEQEQYNVVCCMCSTPLYTYIDC